MHFYFPNDRVVDTHIVMNNSIPKSPDSMPIYGRVLMFKFFCQSVRSFANDFKISNYCIDCFTIAGKLVKGHSGCIFQNFVTAI